jgi:hypothetical protein
MISRMMSTLSKAIYNIVANTYSIDEGGVVTFTITTANVPNNTILYYTIEGGVQNTDFVDNLLTGSFIINNNIGSFSKTLVDDLTTEGAETFIVRIRTISTAGLIVSTCGTVTVNSTLLLISGQSYTDLTAHTTVSLVGSASLNAGVSKFGQGSIYIPATPTSYISCVYNASLALGASDFTVECWFNIDAITAGNQTLMSWGVTGSMAGFQIIINATTGKITQLCSVNGVSYAFNKLSTVGVTAGVWYHIASVRSGSVWTMYLNGTSIMTNAISGALWNPGTSYRFGLAASTSQYKGYIENIRVTKVARYTADFAVPTMAFPTRG